MKALLVLIQSIFQSGDNQFQIVFAHKNGFHEALKQLLVGDTNFRRYIRAFFRQNLTYKQPAIDDQDSDFEFLLKEQESSGESKWKKFLNDNLKLRNLNKEKVEDFLMRQESQTHMANYSLQEQDFANDELLDDFRERTMSIAMRTQQDINSEFDLDSQFNDELLLDEMLPSRHLLEIQMTSCDPSRSISPNHQLSLELQEVFNKINKKPQID